MKTAIIVLLQTSKMAYDTNYMSAELTNLCETDDIQVVDCIVQKADKPAAEFYVGKGKVEEIKASAQMHNADLIIFDDELSPSQTRNLEEATGVTVRDRSYIILEIFATRAKSKESILEINLARSRYMLPRLSLLQEGMSRQGGGGSGLHNRGAGETKLELDRRVLEAKIAHCEEELRHIKQMKDLEAKKRNKNNIPIVALVGYTNAGKSSTMNKIIEYTEKDSDKMVYEKDELFATLDTSTRKITYKKHEFLLVDTIGFVSKLPHHLVNSFRSTLEEIKNADLIIHVLDISTRYFNEQYQITTNVINNLGCSNIPSLLLLNKYDKYDDQNHIIVGPENLPYSNKSNLNVDKLLDYIYEKTVPYMIDLKLNIPYKEGRLMNIIEEKATINSKLYLDNYVYYDIRISKEYYKMLEIYEANSDVN